jgi:predicted amidohydrolase
VTARNSSDLPLAVRAKLWYDALPIHVTGALAGRQFPTAKAPGPDQVTVGLCQVKFGLSAGGADFAGRIYRYVRSAVQKGANFVVFPEYTGAMLLGLLPNVARYAGTAASLESAAAQLGATPGDVFRAAAPAAVPIYRDTFSQLAQRFRVTIVAGSTVLPGRDGRLFNVAHLYGPNGALLGVQPKLHLTPLEEGWLTPGSELKVFELPFGKIAMPICMDYTYWETVRLAWLLGAEILVDPSADDRGDVESLRARGVRMRVQEAPCYGLQALMITDLFQLHWRGRSAVHAPTGLLPAGQADLGVTRSDSEEDMLVVPLDMAALRKWRRENPPEFNFGVFQKYLPALYTQYREKTPDGRRQI